MNYDDCLKVVKAQNPKMPYKKQQKAASDMFQNFKTAQSAHASNDKEFAAPPKDEAKPAKSVKSDIKEKPAAEKPAAEKPGEDIPTFYKPQLSKRVPIGELASLEKDIRAVGINRNTIISMARPIIPEGDLKIEGKEGVNYLVIFGDKYGNKVPVYGHFKIFLAGGPEMEKFREITG